MLMNRKYMTLIIFSSDTTITNYFLALLYNIFAMFVHCPDDVCIVTIDNESIAAQLIDKTTTKYSS